MKLSTLITRACAQRLASDPHRLGLRLSPLALTRDAAVQLAEELPREMGPELFLVVSAPGVPRIDKPRLFVAPDGTAAEKATSWRNDVRPSKGQHLVYVSAEEHDKASGLGDMLTEVTDRDLASAFAAYCNDKESGLPQGLGEILETNGLLERVSPDALCEFAAAVAKDARKLDAWEAVGANLPLVGLAKDTALRKANADDRLKVNQQVVSRASGGEARHRTGAGPTAQVQETLADHLADAPAGPERRRALEKVDLGTVPTADIRRAVAPRRRERAVKAAGRGDTRRKPKKGARGAREQSELEFDPQPVPEPRALEAEPETEAPSTGGTRGLPVAQALPDGLEVLLREALNGNGRRVEVGVRGNARQCLSKLPGGVVPEPQPVSPALEATEEWKAWQAARTALLGVLSSSDPRVELRHLVRAPQKVFSRPELRPAAEHLLDAVTRLFALAARRSESEGECASILSLESIAIREADGVALLLLSPLHPLWLSQALTLARLAQEPEFKNASASALLKRAAESPSAPMQWPLEDGGQLLLGRSELGLVVYQRRPDSVGNDALKHTGRVLLQRFLSLCPHASVGVRVAVLGGDASALLEGMAELLLDEQLAPRLARLECATEVAPALDRKAAQAASDGRLTIRGVPSSADALDELRPHLVVRFTGSSAAPEQVEPGDPNPLGGAHAGLLRTEFSIDEMGLRARTSVAGHPALEAVEALHAAARRRASRREFVTEARAVTLQAALPPAGAPASTWHAAIGARLGRRPPSDFRLLAYEPIDVGATCAVVTREVRPAARAVADGLRLLQISTESNRTLTAIANKLAGAYSSGLLSLAHDDAQLIAAGVLTLELQRQLSSAGSFVLARLEGSHYEALMGERPEADPLGSVVIGAVAGPAGLSLIIGYASLSVAVDAPVSRGQLRGAVGERIGRLSEVCELGNGTGPSAVLAREALAWFLWPAMASQGIRDDRLVQAVSKWGAGTPATLSATVLLPTLPSLPKDKPLRIGDVPTTAAMLDKDLFNRLVLAA